MRGVRQILGFVDSDDYIAPNMYDLLIKTMEKNDCDMALCNNYRVQGQSITEEKWGEEDAIYSHDEAMKKILTDSIGSQVWNKLYKRELYEGITFPLMRKYEDIPTTYRYVHRCQKIAFIKEPLYYYLIRGSGISLTFDPKNAYHIYLGFKERYEFAKNEYPKYAPDCLEIAAQHGVNLYNLYALDRSNISDETFEEIYAFLMENRGQIFRLKKAHALKLKLRVLAWNKNVYCNLYKKYTKIRREKEETSPKIGILSMQRLFNYGSFLQAYGLKHILEDLGYQVEFIDVKLSNGEYLNIPSKRTWQFYLRNTARRLLRSKIYNLQMQRAHAFLYKYFPLLKLDKPNDKTDYDAVVIGSDEVFSYAQFTQWGGTKLYFGQGIKSDRIISYAGSFGYTNYESIVTLHMADELSNLLRGFSAISVRDENSQVTVQKLLGITPPIHLDPVLIYDFESLLPKRLRYRDYILVYGYDDRLCEPEIINQVRNFAQKNNKTILGAGVFQHWCDVNINVTPFELLAYVKNADYVVTETFHGTVFSIKYQKNFAAVVRDSNRNKLEDLLNRFGLIGRAISSDKTLSTIFSESYDKCAVQKILSEEKQKAIHYLEIELEKKVI